MHRDGLWPVPVLWLAFSAVMEVKRPASRVRCALAKRCGGHLAIDFDHCVINAFNCLKSSARSRSFVVKARQGV